MSQLSVVVSGSDGSELIAFSEEEEALVFKSWNTMKKDVATLCLKFFLRYLRLHPWLQSSSPSCKTHRFHLRRTKSSKAMQCLSSSWFTVRETTLKKIGTKHVVYGVLDELFEICSVGDDKRVCSSYVEHRDEDYMDWVACLYSKLKFFAFEMCIDEYGTGSHTAVIQDIDWR
ncbi:hypothetical protein KFK09_028314 [Dendrobium nobile]|uniref:Uncharacterized protein n=1 Tax=Dendrobium nobile TaxID=94219 RepID=A0A8T3A2S8_DENNO|nr:hypothetical protein KFK09_028314 [Dendrobium nobile]